jgi:3-deoxy-D-manno-octulosonic-acid transferase
LAPRHPERIPDVLARMRRVGLEAARWSEQGRPSAPIVVVDTVGELSRIYGAADAAFIGGSLVPIGGHNLLEPAVFGIPMLTGPHHWTVSDTLALLGAAGALRTVNDSRELAGSVRDLFARPVEAREAGLRGQAVLAAHRGAASRCADALMAQLRPSESVEMTAHG